MAYNLPSSVMAGQGQGLPHRRLHTQNPIPISIPIPNPKRIFPPTQLPTFTSSSRLNNSLEFKRRPRLFGLFASNSNPSSGDSITEKSVVTKSSDTAQGQGPPFLTILAGFLVFSIICWMLGSVIMWSIGVIVRLPPK